MDYPHIVKTPETCGGLPRIEGTRITVNLIVTEIVRARNSPEEVLMISSPLDARTNSFGFAYYFDNRCRGGRLPSTIRPPGRRHAPPFSVAFGSRNRSKAGRLTTPPSLEADHPVGHELPKSFAFMVERPRPAWSRADDQVGVSVGGVYCEQAQSKPFQAGCYNTCMNQPHTLGELKASGYHSSSVKDEMRRNLIRKLKAAEPIFDGILGYEETVLPQCRMRSSPGTTCYSSAYAARPRRACFGN